MAVKSKPVGNPRVVVREESDDWAVLYDPETGNAFGLDPVGLFIWKLLDGEHTSADILYNLQENCDDVPPDADKHISDFLSSLDSKGLLV